MAKRMRKANFSSAERAALIEEFSLRKDILNQKFKTNSANKDKQNMWLEICEAVNSVSKIGHSVGEYKEKWSKLSSEARSQLCARKYPPTGSGKVDEMPDLHLFEPLFGDSDLIEGLSEDVGGFDSGDPAPIQASCRRQSPSQEKLNLGSDILWQIVVDNTPSTSSRSESIVPEDDDSAVSASASRPGQQLKRSPVKRRAPVQENQSELYCKYLAVSIELKELKKQQLQDGLHDNELQKMLKDKTLLDIQCSQANLERVLCKKKQDDEIYELEKEKLKLEIQSLKAKCIDANK